MTGCRYGLPIRLLHWVMAVLLVSAVVLGFSVAYLPVNDAVGYLMVRIHKALGVVLMVACLLRIVCRLLSDPVPYSKKISRVSVLLAKSVHFALYSLMVLMPVSGYVMSSASGRSINMGYFVVPALIPKNQMVAGFFAGVHEVLAFALMALVLLHILGAVKHLVIDRENVFRRII